MVVYEVYGLREEGYYLDSVLNPPVRDILSLFFIFIGFLGIVANAVVLLTFHTFYPHWRETTRMWVNLTVCMFAASITLLFQSVGDWVELMSGSKNACYYRLIIPRSFDITIFACLAMMLIDRMTILQFPNLYIYNKRNDNCKIIYSWLLGAFYVVYEMFIKTSNYEPIRCLGPFTKSIPWETVTDFEMFLSLLLFLVALLAYVFSRYPESPLHKAWMDIELEETFRILVLGGCVLCLRLPTTIIRLYFIVSDVEPVRFQVYTTLVDLPFRATLLLPFAILSRRKSFIKATSNLRTPKEKRPAISSKLGAKESNADYLLHDALMNMYPNHPELANEQVNAALRLQSEYAVDASPRSSEGTVGIKKDRREGVPEPRKRVVSSAVTSSEISKG